MRNFCLIKLHNEPYDYLVIATNYRSSLSDLSELQNIINIKSGKIIFDFMLIHGNKKNRFVECEVVNSELRKNTFKLVEKIDQDIKATSLHYFLDHKELVEHSILPKALKYLITTGTLV